MRSMWKTCRTLTLALPFAASLAAPPTAAQGSEPQLGAVDFKTSCNEVAQRRFNRAMRYQHSFWYRQAIEVFEEAAKADETCAMAQWGIALSLLNNPHSAIPQSNLAPGLAAIEKAKAIGAKSERERDYIEALSKMYIGHDKTTHQVRVQAYRDAMAALASRYPQDDEAQIAYAIALNVSASPADKTYAQQLKGAGILEPMWKRLPQHPGVAHYLIHLYDYPPIAEKGLKAAVQYSKIAPAAPHAQHMPSHIFTRVGYWKESIASNMASVKAAKADKEANDQLHGTDYLVYAHLQLAQDKQALAFIEEMAKVEFKGDSAGGHFARAASPARFAVERGDWKAAAALEPMPTKFAHVTAITHFARALGAARSGDVLSGWVDAKRLMELRDRLTAAKDTYWAEQVEIQFQVASAWLLHAEGKHDAALALLRSAADAEDKTEKSPVTPGPLAPARELLGAMLLARDKPAEALAAFEATLAKEPNRYRAYAGAVEAAQRSGNNAKAKTYAAKLLAMVGGGASDRPELARARQLAAK